MITQNFLQPRVNKLRSILTMRMLPEQHKAWNYPGSKFHGLKIDLAGHYSITVTGNIVLLSDLSMEMRSWLITRITNEAMK